MNTAFDFLYTPRDEVRWFGACWCGPAKYDHAAEHLIAIIPHQEGGDGQTVEVYCCAMPAQFFSANVLAGPNSVGDTQPAYRITSGSSQGKLIADIAKAISEGMLGFEALAAVRGDK